MRIAIPKDSLFIMVASLLAGLGISFFLAQMFWSSTRMTRLEHYTRALLKHTETVSADIVAALEETQADGVAVCSPADLEKLKGIQFAHGYIKDVGRIGSGAIVCSAVRGRLDPPYHLNSSAYVTPTGHILWTSASPYWSSGDLITIVQKDDVFVATSDKAFAAFDQTQAELNAEVVLPGKDHRLARFGVLYPEGDNVLRRVYTSCSERFSFCVRGQIDTNMFSRGYAYPMALILALGALTGALLYVVISARLKRSLRMDERLVFAIESGRIYLMYQPIVRASTGELVGIEALARWSDPYLGEVRPDIFISVANHIGKRDELNAQIIQRAFREAAPLLRENPSLYLSLNLDICSFCDSATVGLINTLTSRHQLTPAQIAIEILENSTSEIEQMQKAISNLRKIGYLVFLDDFGVGYSGLAYLGKLDVDKIKIDRMFSQTAGDGSPAARILSMVTSMAQDLDVGTIFEGIETTGQLAALTQEHPEALVQGWIYSKAVAIDQIRSRYPLFPGAPAVSDELTAGAAKSGCPAVMEV